MGMRSLNSLKRQLMRLMVVSLMVMLAQSCSRRTAFVEDYGGTTCLLFEK